MGTDIHGWVEFNSRLESGEDLWFRVIELQPLVERNHAVFGALFGIRECGAVRPVAKGRGLPAGTHFGGEPGTEWLTGITWATFEEVEPPLTTLCGSDHLSGWFFVLQSMKALAERFGAKDVRLVVGFDNGG